MPAIVQYLNLGLDPRSATMLKAGVALVARERPALAAKLKGITGYGSYRKNAASAGIDSGGGHADVNAENLTDEEARYVCKQFRRVGIVASFRPRSWYSSAARKTIKPGWQRHIHCTFKGVGDATQANLNQTYAIVTLGQDGLARKAYGYDKDRDDRTWINSTYEAYLQLAGTVGAIAVSVIVEGLQAAVRAYRDGKWGEQTDIDLRNLRAAAMDPRYFVDSRWDIVQRKRMQKAWGTTQDGKWGPATASALLATTRKVQAALGQVADGKWGPVTDAAFRTLRAKVYTGKALLPSYQPAKAKPVTPKPAPAAKPAAKPVDFTVPYVRTGPSGFFPYPGQQGKSYYGPSKSGVAWYSGKTAGGTKKGRWDTGGLDRATVQARIRAIQKLVGASQDGDYGDKTVEKVRAWQKAHKLPADGIVGPTTWRAMAASRGQ